MYWECLHDAFELKSCGSLCLHTSWTRMDLLSEWSLVMTRLNSPHSPALWPTLKPRKLFLCRVINQLPLSFINLSNYFIWYQTFNVLLSHLRLDHLKCKLFWSGLRPNTQGWSLPLLHRWAQPNKGEAQ
jgi:hypothetical protein